METRDATGREGSGLSANRIRGVAGFSDDFAACASRPSGGMGGAARAEHRSALSESVGMTGSLRGSLESGGVSAGDGSGLRTWGVEREALAVEEWVAASRRPRGGVVFALSRRGGVATFPPFRLVRERALRVESRLLLLTPFCGLRLASSSCSTIAVNRESAAPVWRPKGSRRIRDAWRTTARACHSGDCGRECGCK